jgi:CRP-like cAMP-binding protein
MHHAPLRSDQRQGRNPARSDCGRVAARSVPTNGDLQIISRTGVFRGLRPETVARVIAPATAVMLSPHDILFRHADPATAFFIVIHGFIKLCRITISGEETVVNVLTKGGSYAETHALTGGRYPATAEAVTSARVVRIPADHVVRCIRENADIALAMIATASHHLHDLVQQIEQLKAQSGVQRVADFLASLVSVESGCCDVPLPYEKTLIAGQLGLKPESLSRTFAKLRSVGVAVRASRVGVSDIGKLRRIAANERATVRGAFRERLAL